MLHRIGTAAVVSATIFFATGLAPSGARAETPQKIMALPGVKEWTGDFDAMKERRFVRILVPFSKTYFYLDGGEALGIEAEFGQQFEAWLTKRYGKKPFNMNVVFVPTSRERIFTELAAGKGDIAAGGLTVTPERQALVDFAAPWASGVKEVLVTGPAAADVKSFDDLGDRAVSARKTSSYHPHLVALNEQRHKEGKRPLKLENADEALEDEDLLEMVSHGLLPAVVVDRFLAKGWAKILPGLTVHDDLVVNEGGDIAWAVRKNSPLLSKELEEFVAKNKIGTSFGDDLRVRYLNNPKAIRNALARGEADKLVALLKTFQEYGGKFALDPLLLAAQGYQESGFDQKMRNRSGAVGVMQIKPSTAREKQIAINDVVSRAEDNIHAGAKYMRFLSDKYIPDPAIAARERALMTLAAYNAGPGNLAKFRDYAVKHGFRSDAWFGNVEYGAAAIVGQETVQYVGNIYKYYLVYSSRDFGGSSKPAAPGADASAEPRSK